MKPPGTPWTADELALLARLYPNSPTKEVAALLDRPVKRVLHKAWQLQIGKSPEFMAANQVGRITPGEGATRGLATRFAPGQKPWNAGRKGWQAGGRSVQTQFHTGQLPPTTMPIGSYRLVHNKANGPRLERKVREVPGSNDKRWTPVTRLVWEAAHGPVPKGSIVVFKPGRVTHVLELITLDAIECITRAENSRRNHPRNKSPEIGRLVQLKGAITRQVNRITRAHEAQQQTQGQPA
jgi:hypothetical protein